MEDEKYKMKFIGILLSIILVAVLITFLIFSYDRYTNFDKYSKKDDESQLEQKENIDIASPQIQLMNPFSGDFVSSALLYLTQIQQMQRSDLTNEFVLKMAFAKILNQDIGLDLSREYDDDENVRFTLDANVLEESIGKIFGSLNYYKNDFNTLDLYLLNSDKTQSDSFLYTVKYNKRKDEYSITFNDLEELVKIERKELISSNVIPAYQEAVKYEDRIELDIYPVFVKKQGNLTDEEAAYICYKSYDFEEKKFKWKLTDSIYVKNEEPTSLTEAINRQFNLNRDNEESGENNILNDKSKNELDEAIEKIDKNELNDYKFVFVKDENGAYIFDSFSIISQ